MKYNIIGDIHGRTNWIYLVLEDAINIFVGDYFSPYDDDISFEDCKRNFLDIIEYKKKHWDNTVLLIGNHDEDHWHICECYSRHDFAHEDDIRELFEMYKGLFQAAYSIENKVLVTHAGVSYVWYDRYKNHNENAYEHHNCNYDDPDEIKNPFSKEHELIPFENPLKFSLTKTPEDAYQMWADKSFRYFIPENKKPKNGEFILWRDQLWKYNKDLEKFEVFAPEPDEIAEFINKAWKEDENYRAFDFRSNAGPMDNYGDSIGHGPMWIRPDALTYVNIFEGRNFWQVFGHTKSLSGLIPYNFEPSKSLATIEKIIISEKHKMVMCDCLGTLALSVIYDSDTETFSLNYYDDK